MASWAHLSSIGLGGTVSTFFSGWLLDTAHKKARTKRGLSTDKVRGDDLDDFPIEKARLSVMWIPMVVIGVCIVGYGWVLDGEEVYIPHPEKRSLSREAHTQLTKLGPRDPTRAPIHYRPSPPN
jgi:hypothetical protein